MIIIIHDGLRTCLGKLFQSETGGLVPEWFGVGSLGWGVTVGRGRWWSWEWQWLCRCSCWLIYLLIKPFLWGENVSRRQIHVTVVYFVTCLLCMWSYLFKISVWIGVWIKVAEDISNFNLFFCSLPNERGHHVQTVKQQPRHFGEEIPMGTRCATRVDSTTNSMGYVN